MADIEGIGSSGGPAEPLGQLPSYEVEGSDQLTMLRPWNPKRHKIIAQEVGLELDVTAEQ